MVAWGNINAVSSIDGISWTKPKMLITSESESGNPKYREQVNVHPKSKHGFYRIVEKLRARKGVVRVINHQRG